MQDCTTRAVKTRQLKIAVELFGHLRTYRQCHNSLQKHLLSKYECDVFLHTWSTINHTTQTWHKNKMINKNASTYEREEELKKIYNLKGVCIEKQEAADLGNIIVNNKKMSIFGISCMFHSMKESNRLREEYSKKHEIDYDFVVMVRPDIHLKKEFSIEKFIDRLTIEEINKSCFAAGNPLGALLSEFRMLGATDLLFFAKPELLSDVFQSVDRILENLAPNKSFNHGPEYFLPKAIQDLGYKPVLLNYTFGDHFDIVRPATLSMIIRQILRLRIRKTGIIIYLLQFLVTNVIRLKIVFFDRFLLDICIGRVKG
jgi:hypothetical protein